MSRFPPRPPRRPRGRKAVPVQVRRAVKARRNFDLADLARLDTPTLLVLPVGYQAVRAAAEMYRTLDKAQTANERIQRFVSLYSRIDSNFVNAVYPEGDSDRPEESILLELVFRINAADVYREEAKAALNGQGTFEIEDVQHNVTMTQGFAEQYLAALENEDITSLASELEPLLGEVSFALSLMPLPSHGLLSGEGFDLARVKLNRRIKDIVLELDSKLQSGTVSNTPWARYAATQDPNSWKSVVPTVEVGPHFTQSGTEVGRAIFAVMGKDNDPLSLFPMTDMQFRYPDGAIQMQSADGAQSDSRSLVTSAVAEGILRHAIEMGLWRLTGFNHFGDQQWSWKGNLQFAYPAPVPAAKENDPPITAGVPKLIEFIEAAGQRYRGAVDGVGMVVDTNLPPDRSTTGRATVTYDGENYRVATRSGQFRDGKGLRLTGKDLEMFVRVPREDVENDTAVVWGSFRHKGREINVPFTPFSVDRLDVQQVAPGFARLLTQAAQALRSEARAFPGMAAGFLAKAIQTTVFDPQPVINELNQLAGKLPPLSFSKARDLLIRGGMDPFVVDEWLKENQLSAPLASISDVQRAAVAYGLRPYQYQGDYPVVGRAVPSATRDHFLSWYGQRRIKEEGPLKAKIQQAYIRMADNLGTSSEPGALSMAENFISKQLNDPFSVKRFDFDPPLAAPEGAEDLAITIAGRMLQSQIYRSPELNKAELDRLRQGVMASLNGRTVAIPGNVEGDAVLADIRVEGNPLVQVYAPLGQPEGKLVVQEVLRDKSGQPIQPTERINLSYQDFARLMSGEGIGKIRLTPNGAAVLSWFDPYQIAREAARRGTGAEPLLYIGFRAASMPLGVRTPPVADRYRLDARDQKITSEMLTALNNKRQPLDVADPAILRMLGDQKFVLASSRPTDPRDQQPFKVYDLVLRGTRYEEADGRTIKVNSYSVELLPPARAAAVLRGAERRAREALVRAQAIANDIAKEVQIPFEKLAQQVQEVPILPAIGDIEMDDGVARLMPLMGTEPSWFGSSDVERSLALMGVRHRADLMVTAEDKRDTDKRHQYGTVLRGAFRPKTFLYLSFLQGLNPDMFSDWDEDLASSIRNVQGKNKAIRSIAEGMSMELYTGLSRDEQVMQERNIFKQVHEVERKSISLPIEQMKDRILSNVIQSGVFTIYGLIDEAAKNIMQSRGRLMPNPARYSMKALREFEVPAEYGVFWQSPVLSIAQMRKIVEQARQIYTQPEPLGPVDLSKVEIPRVEYVLEPEAAMAVRSGLKTMDIQGYRTAGKTKLGPGEVGQFGSTTPIYVRFRGNKRLNEVLASFHEDDESTAFERLIEAAFPDAWAANVRTKRELLAGERDAAKRQWLTGMTKLPVYDLAVAKKAIIPFASIQDENSEFNPAQALICWMANESGLIDLADVWAKKEQLLVKASKEQIQRNPEDEGEKVVKAVSPLRLPFMIVGTLMVDRPSIQACKIKEKLPKTFQLGDSQLGLMLTQLKLSTPAGSKVPTKTALLSPYTPVTVPTGFVPKWLSVNDVPKLSVNFIKVSYAPSRDNNSYRLIPQMGTNEETPNIFSYSNLLRSTAFRDELNEALMENDAVAEQRAEAEKQEKKEDKGRLPKVKKKDNVVDDVYIDFLKSGLVGGGAVKEHEALIGGRRGYAGERGAYRGTGTRISAGAQRGAMVATDRTSKVMITQQRGAFTDPFQWVEKLLDQTGMTGVRPARASTMTMVFPGQRRHRTVVLPLDDTKKEFLVKGVGYMEEGQAFVCSVPLEGVYAQFQVGEKLYTEFDYEGHRYVMSIVPLEVGDNEVYLAVQYEEEMPSAGAAASYETEEDERLAALMDQYGIWVEPAETPEGQLENMKNALLRLKAAMESGYDYRMSTGVLLPQIREKQQETNDTDEIEALRYTESFLRDMEEIAKNNPRGRRPRRERRPRRVRGNPINERDYRALVDYTSSKTEDAARAAESVFRRIAPEADSWNVTQPVMDELFPRSGRAKRIWSPEERLKALQQYDLISRLAPEKVEAVLRTISPDVTLSQFRNAISSPDSILGSPEYNNVFLNIFKNQFGLSLQEALQILEAQYDRTKSERTIPASAALSKMYRTRRLKDYELPQTVRQVVGNRDTLIWMSPVNVSSPRVMTFKRGAHVDADMMAKQSGESMPDLLAKAVRSVLYWMAEKPQRRTSSNLWVGRAGDPRLYIVWKPGDPLNINQIAATLQSAIQSGESSLYRAAYRDDGERQQDIRAFTERVGSQPADEELPPPPQTPPRPAGPVATPVSESAEDDTSSQASLEALIQEKLDLLEEDSVSVKSVLEAINGGRSTPFTLDDVKKVKDSLIGWQVTRGKFVRTGS